jgi:hypothetical protein
MTVFESISSLSVMLIDVCQRTKQKIQVYRETAIRRQQNLCHNEHFFRIENHVDYSIVEW